MKNVYELPKREDPIDIASDWIAKMDRGLNRREEMQLKSWLESDRRNRDTLMQVAKLWDRMDALSRLSDMFPEQKVEQRQNIRHPALALAASLLVAIIIGFWDKVGVEPAAEHQALVYETATGEHSTINLSDGSQLTLNTDSLVRVRYNANERALMLERGEIHVQVAHEKARPLNVYVGNRVVQAVGTAFNIEITSEQHIELIVTEGKVIVAINEAGDEPAKLERENGAPLTRLSDSSVAVSAGEQLLLSESDSDIVSIEAEEIDVKLSWRDGDLIFRGEPLGEAIAEIGRYTSVEFIILDENLRKMRVAGLFKAGDVDGLLDTLSKNFNVSYHHVSEEKVILSKNW